MSSVNITAVNITASVGKNGKNKIEDVFPIQILLNKFIIPGCLKPTAVLVVDGIVGNKTIGAIKDFQHRILGFSKPDGRIDPGAQTLAALNGPLKWAKPSVTPATTDDHKSTQWAILLLKTDYIRFRWEFELVNVESKRAHGLVFIGAGIVNLEADRVNRSIEKWIKSGRYITFKWVPTAFKDFHLQLATITPSYGDRGDHALTIGTDLKIKMWPIPYVKGQWYEGRWVLLPNELSLHGSCKVEYGSGKPSKPLIWYK